MPSISKQPPGRLVQAPPAPNGSLLSRAVPVASLANKSKLSVLIYGTNRVGKTTLACQFEKPLILVSFEPNETGGADSVVKIPGVDYLHLDSSTEIAEFCLEMREDKRYKSVVVDGATSLQDLCLREILGLPELPAQLKVPQGKGDQSYGVVTGDQYKDRSAKAKELLRKLLNIPDKNRIVLGKEKDHNPPKDEKTDQVRRDKLTRGLSLGSFIAPDLGQATAEWLMDNCNCVCRLYLAKETREEKLDILGQESVQVVETGRTVRRLLTQLHPNFAAGIRSASPDKVPEFIEGATPKELHDRLLKVLRG